MRKIKTEKGKDGIENERKSVKDKDRERKDRESEK
jgi:hypothetical protein